MARASYDNIETASDAGTPETLPNFDTTVETRLERSSVNCVGACCFVLLGILGFSWAVYALPLSWVSDAPAFARNLIWLSIAHHTDQWQDHIDTLPPPPPSFGDGNGNFAD